MARSILAVVSGFLLIALLSFAANAILQQTLPTAFDAGGRVESAPVLLLIMGYVGIFAVAGCYLTARLAPNRPMRHALVLGALGLVFNIAGTVALWHTAPAWYHLGSLALVLPYAWIGGRLREAQLSRSEGKASALAV